jgi:hypothetical protein
MYSNEMHRADPKFNDYMLKKQELQAGQHARLFLMLDCKTRAIEKLFYVNKGE